ncbi:MAG TPA: anti-sigma factor [Solirubrobacterales bacterium]|jgi:anti-sigma factor RsiW
MNAHDHDRRLEEVAAFALGALDADRIADVKEHLNGCKRCQEELRWLSPAVRALPEAVEPQVPPPALKHRLMEEVRADAAAAAKHAREEERRERAASRKGFGEWLRGLRLGGLTYKPLAGIAALVLVVAAVAGYAVGTGGSGSDNVRTITSPQGNGIVAKVVTEGNRAEVRLANVKQLPEGKVLEAWVQRGNAVEPVPALFAPDHAGNASTTIEDMKNVSLVMVTREPAGGTKVPTTEPIVKVPVES